MPGVYITTQLAEDNSVHSRITFDKGGTWHPIQAPEGSSCAETDSNVSVMLIPDTSRMELKIAFVLFVLSRIDSKATN